ncbi:MAG: exodeoxyribonuclease V subunit alpha [Deltaproteobacteria bacterium]|nr:exodeoxyribonuclease V subunit alpha [Deltaproteobacteria bacterium]
MEETKVLNTLLGPGGLSEVTDQVARVYMSAQRLELPFLDLMTARDLVRMGRYEDDAPLLGVLLCLFRAMEEGSLCMDLQGDSLKSRLLSFLDSERARDMADAFLSGLSRGRYQGLIARSRDEYLPLFLSETAGEKLLYFHKYYLHEEMLRRRMETLLRDEAGFIIPGPVVEACLEEIYSPGLSICVSAGGPPMKRDPFQVEAIRLALNTRFSMVSGGPGTGKTSLMVNMIRCLVRAGVRADKILLGAPTGRAAQRMTEAIQQSIGTILEPSPEDTELLGLKGSTLHKMLGYQSRQHDFYHGEANPLPASAIILDEVSMVDLIMMEKFLRAVDPSETRLIFLGDKDQLPSVEAGAVFAEMIPAGTRGRSFRGRLTVLKNVYRSGAGLLSLAKQVNKGLRPRFSPVSFDEALGLNQDMWAFVRNHGREVWREDLRLWVEAHYMGRGDRDRRSFRDLIGDALAMDHSALISSSPGREILEKIFRRVNRARVLSLIRKGIYGSEGINREVARHLCPDSRAWTRDGFFSGAVVMITRNDYSKELFNGDVGVVIREGTGAHRAFFPRYGTYITFSMDLLPPWELAFAMTVHKAQGSEFDDVLLVLPEDETHRLLTREIVYTGITRAKRRLIIYGREGVMETALGRKIERRSGFRW